MSKTFSGWVIFAAIMLFIAGVLNVIYGIAAIADSKFFVQDQKYILSNLNTWGWITLILGGGQLFAGYSLWSGGLYGRVFAILAAGLSAIDIIVIHQVAKHGAAGVEKDERDPARVQAARRDLVT